MEYLTKDEQKELLLRKKKALQQELVQVLISRRHRATENPKKKEIILHLPSEFPDIPLSQLKQLEQEFKKMDSDKDGLLNLMELSSLLQATDTARTHLQLKDIMRSFNIQVTTKDRFDIRDFLKIFCKVQTNELADENIFKNFTEIDVAKFGIKNAAKFFEQKAEQLLAGDHSNEVQSQRNQRVQAEELRQKRLAAFKQFAFTFEPNTDKDGDVKQ